MAKIQNPTAADSASATDTSFTANLPLGEPTDVSADEYLAQNGGEGAPALDLDFNATDDYRPIPLIPNGLYQANISDTKINLKSGSIAIELTLADNGGVLSDGETPLDGARCVYSLWLPKAGDDKEYIKSGLLTKKQWKVNTIFEFFQSLNEPVTTMASINEIINNKVLVGRRLLVEVTSEEYKGRMQNRTNNVKAVAN